MHLKKKEFDFHQDLNFANQPEVISMYFLASKLTLGADATQVSDFHQHAREHVRFVGSAASSVDLQSFQQGLLQTIYTFRLLKIHSVYRERVLALAY